MYRVLQETHLVGGCRLCRSDSHRQIGVLGLVMHGFCTDPQSSRPSFGAANLCQFRVLAPGRHQHGSAGNGFDVRSQGRLAQHTTHSLRPRLLVFGLRFVLVCPCNTVASLAASSFRSSRLGVSLLAIQGSSSIWTLDNMKLREQRGGRGGGGKRDWKSGSKEQGERSGNRVPRVV